ncbi:universal stress protein [Azorhizobium doebereinerae]|uniref:universal stress protein n=1 Tax=Azorhizobium doebereinerae TaxID=281091 RepID=UPI00040D2A3F|nr:universal stress protein [Azorhizobium doebereinerae]
MSLKRQSHEPGHHRKFLVIVDDTPECDRAVYYAARRAARTRGGLVLLAVLELEDAHQQWLGVADLMRAEATDEARRRLDAYVARARQVAGVTPETAVREGGKVAVLQALIAEDRDIAILVLAAGLNRDGPGPLVTALGGAASAAFPIPITIVPGALSDEDLDAMA